MFIATAVESIARMLNLFDVSTCAAVTVNRTRDSREVGASNPTDCKSVVAFTPSCRAFVLKLLWRNGVYVVPELLDTVNFIDVLLPCTVISRVPVRKIEISDPNAMPPAFVVCVEYVIFVIPANVEAVAPKETEVDPIVTLLFVRALFGIAVKVFVAPLIDLFVNVSVPPNVASVPVTVGNVRVALARVMVAGMVKATLVNTSVPPVGVPPNVPLNVSVPPLPMVSVRPLPNTKSAVIWLSVAVLVLL